ncbi:acyl-CoA thioesterase [Arcticibacterium luteifluviistationis]|uniref:Acyl-CoA thioesterase 2 n=1 Tax=Arcticibacterium luteifluviistationis TaxID=1784714 RepID=A0A2Z4GGR4_9BACT|nr:acyl-CoA thioesterase II [Arcticibacterium luteifluviistationis]AWW00236.1 acyl-CoA thioesterase II [Arcticibacterium luteifluviistationis]
MKDINELIKLIELEELSPNIYVGHNYQAPWNRVFGGQVLSQAVSAAYKTVAKDRFAHSLHAYFLLAGDISIPIHYEVESIRDGGSFSTRRVVAKQNDVPIFITSISFQSKQEGFDHQIDMPNVVGPEGLKSDEDLVNKYKLFVPQNILQSIKTRPFEFRPVEKLNVFDRSTKPPYKHIWFKAKEKVEGGLDVHQTLLTYVSDYNLLTTATLPHTKGPIPKDLFMASLDHAMWFHRDFRIDEWMLYALDSPSASNTRGFTRGNIFTQKGKLVASVVQEGLIRKAKKGTLK